MPTIVDCQFCNRKLRVPDDLLGRRVKCPTCAQEFTAQASTPAPAPPPGFALPGAAPRGPTPAPPPPPPRSYAPSSPYDEFGECRPSTSSARDAVIAPAVALLVAGIIGLVSMGGLTVLGTLGWLMEDAAHANAEEVAEFITGVLMFTVAALANAAIIFCAIQMQRLKSYALALTGAILAVIPGISPCCVLGIPFGIWALVVIHQPDVKNAFPH